MGTSGSEGGPGKPTSRKADRAPRSDPYTYVSTWSGFAYIAFVTDAYARRILGWRVAATMATSMVLDAIEHAIWTRQQEGVLDLKDVVHHTDR
jgi:putative transposase